MVTINDNILKIKETFDDIAAAIEEKGVDVDPCDSPTSYANKIRLIDGEGGVSPYIFDAEVFETEQEPYVITSVDEDSGVLFSFYLLLN